MVELTEKMLLDAGGWQAMKHAKALVEMKRVISANYTPPLLKGLVREGETEYRAGLKIVSKTNIENICTCRQSREWGTLCAHSLAVGLAAARKTALADEPQKQAAPAATAQPAVRPRFVESERPDLRVYFILPPNFDSAWERGHIMLGIEADYAGKRVLIHTLDRSRSFGCAAEDAAAMAGIQTLLGEQTSGMLMVNREQFLAILDSLRGHPRMTLGKAKHVTVRRDELTPKLTVEVLADHSVALKCMLEGKLLEAGGHLWTWSGDAFRALKPGLPAMYHPVFREPIRLDASAGAAFLSNELPNLRSYFEIEQTGEAGAVELVPAIPRVALSLEGSLNYLAAQIQCIYGKRIITVGITPAAEQFTYRDPEDSSKLRTRNPAFEKEALKRLARWGFHGPDTTGHYVIKGQPAILSFFAQELPALQKEWEVSIGSRFNHVTSQVERITPRVEIKGSGEDWFELGFALAGAGDERFSQAEIMRLLQSGQSHTRLRNGKLAVFDPLLVEDFQEVLRDCEPTQVRPGVYRVKKMHAGFLDETFAAHEEIRVEGDRAWTQSARFGAAQSLREMPLGDLEDTLRPYQKQGVYWMHFLAANGLAGVLADEMGLGKTLQTLAFLRDAPGDGPSIVVCPTTLVGNWRREAARFTPQLKLLILDGPDRAKHFPKIGEADLVITSYALIRRDIASYQDVRFRVVVLDEAQHIKNPDTQNAQAAVALRSEHRFVLTGTPMENSVRDLWSIFQFLMPGYLGARDDFKERYEAPLARESEDAAAAQRERLRRRLKPFLLRRTKRDVAPELPDKIEQVVLCDLTAKQASVYEELLKASREKIDDAMRQKDRNRGRMIMLTALLRLRQACCDLRLLDLPAEDSASGKVEMLGELLDEAIDGGHRVLVFSQFVEMLQLLRSYIEQREIAYCYLDGQTKNRMAVVDEFQTNQKVSLFLISLKAGGVGLNLTAADTVIHFDPWWNPAVEAQATDRAHRIGQKNVVTAYKLISRGTVEEKILSLQQKKREMIQSVVESEAAFESGLSLDEIRSLFE